DGTPTRRDRDSGVGMTQVIRANIDRLILRGIDPADRQALIKALRSELARVLSDPNLRTTLAGSRRTPVMKLGRIPFNPGMAGARAVGVGIARAIGRGLKK